MVDIYLIHIGQGVIPAAAMIANDLRKKCGKTVLFETLRRSLKSQMRYATSMDATHAAIVGESELINGTTSLRNMTTRVQEEVKDDDLIGRVAA